MIYLDNAATTLKKPPAVAEAVRRAMASCANPGRSGHAAAMRAMDLVYRARQRAAELFDAAPEQVVFTMNATHGLNLAIHSLAGRGDRVVVSGFEHNAVMRPLYACGAETVVASTALFDPDRTLRDFSRAVTEQTRAVVVNHVSNVFGYVQPLAEIAALCRARGVPLIVDASQSAGVLPLSLKELGAAYLAMPGHKALFGPTGTGLLLCGEKPAPLLYGGTGSQSELRTMPEELPERVEAGTLNVHGIAGLLAGMDFVRSQGSAIRTRELRLRRLLCEGLAAIPGLTVFDGGSTQTGVVSFTAQTDCETLAARLAAREIAVRAGLHCAPLAHRSAGTLERGTVRASVCAFTTAQEIRAFLEALTQIIKNPKGMLETTCYFAGFPV